MLIDTHCHINMMVKSTFDTLLSAQDLSNVQPIIEQAAAHDVTRIINVGTSLIESHNCITLAQQFPHISAVIGIHPNDCTASWYDDVKELKKLLTNETIRPFIVGIGETGLDFHYPEHNFNRQRDAFRTHIELALEHDLALVVHTRDAADETLTILHEYKHQVKRGIIHCFSGDASFAREVISLDYVLGIGGTITYPKNNELRSIVANTALTSIVLETDAPFLPPQIIRGKQNHPLYIQSIAHYLAELKQLPIETISTITTQTTAHIFKLKI